jgi:hypothetical protein
MAPGTWDRVQSGLVTKEMPLTLLASIKIYNLTFAQIPNPLEDRAFNVKIIH